MSPFRIVVVTVAALAVARVEALTVTSVLDDGTPGTLRSVVASTPAGGVVDFGVTGTIVLTGGPIAIAKNLTIAGPGAKQLTIDGNLNGRIFDVGGPVTVSMSGLTLTRGVGNAAPGGGGAIASNATLALNAMRFVDNRADAGGGALYVYRTPGGGAGSASVRASTFSGNGMTGTAGVGGGAILVAGVAATTSPAAPAQRAALTLVNTTVSGNTANAAVATTGGGIAFATADVAIVSSTVAFNRAGAPDAAASGANLHQGTSADTSLVLRNSIVTNGQAGGGAVANALLDLFLPGAPVFVSGGGNLLHHRPPVAWLASDVEAAAQLVALADNGGPTSTHRLDVASPAIAQVAKAACIDANGSALATDQRGVPRTGDACASGAYEPQALLVLSPASRTFALTRGLAFSQAFVASGGVPGYAFAIDSGSVPGLSLSAGTLAGTPTTSGSFALRLRASDSAGSVTPDQYYLFVVRPPAAAVSVVTSNPSVNAGSSVTLTATVTGASPGGTVAFRDGTRNVAGCTAIALVGGGNVRTAQCATGALSLGTHTFFASYPGDANNAPGEGSVVQSVVANPAQACAGFVDVLASSAFCASIDWVRNRAVTQGCAANQFCPDGPVVRLAMAAFLNRLGTVLSPLHLVHEQQLGAVDVDTTPMICSGVVAPAAIPPRRARVDAVVAAAANADMTLAIELVSSVDGGTSWQPMSSVHRGAIAANRWSNQRVLVDVDVAAGSAIRFAARLSRDGLAEATDLSAVRCVLRATVGNRDATASPFDAGEPGDER